jgi:methyl-accepting chemotaxis protein
MNSESDTIETINKSYFYRLAAICIMIIIAAAILAGAFLYISLYKESGSSYAESYGIITGLRGELFHKSAYLYFTTLFFIIIGTTAISLLFSHRVAGPLYRLGVFSRKAASGDLSESVTLRQKDAIYPIADDMNNIMVTYREVLEQLDAKTKEIREMSSTVEPSAVIAEREILEKLSKKVYELNGILSRIKL